MDPSIMKLLEDDEDESIHSGADLEAFTAALNREVEGSGSAASSSQPSDPGAGVLPQESSSKLNYNLGEWQGSVKDEIGNQESQQQEPKHLHLKEQSSGSEMVFEGANNQSQHFNSQSEYDQLKVKQEHSHSNYQLQQAETSTFKFVDKEPANSSQQSIVGLKQDVNRPAEQQHVQQMKSQQAPGMNQTNSAMAMMKTPVIAFHMLIPILSRHLDKDKDMQVQSIFAKLRKNEVSKDHFLRVVRNIVGDQMLRQAASQIQMQHAAQTQRNPQTNPNNYSLLNQVSAQQHIPSGSRLADEQKTFPMAHSVPLKQVLDSSKSPHFGPASTVQMQSSTGYPASESNIQKSRESGHKSDMKGVHALQNRPSNIHSVSLQPLQHHVQHPQTSLPMYGTNNIHARPFPRPLGGPITSLRPQVPDSNPRAPLIQGTVPTLAGTVPTRPMLQTNQAPWQLSANKEQKTSSFAPTTHLNQEIVNQHTESTQRSQTSFAPLHAKQVNPTLGSSKDGVSENRSSAVVASTSMAMTNSSQTHHPHGTPAEPNMQIPSAMQTPFAGAASKPPQKKPSVVQKKPLEALGSSPPPSSKKQKTSGAFLDQSIEQLNDVTAVSGVNLREEEEQLLSAPKEESRVSEAARKVVQLEEEKLILQKGPLMKKLEEIMRKCNLKSIGSDVERCLSMCVEERLRGFISNLVRLSKQRVELEKTRHQFYPLTSDVRSHILRMNREAKEEWDRKQAEEAERLRKQNETDGNTVVDAEKDKNEGRSNSKNAKGYKEEDDKMRTTAANVAVRVAAGGDDMLSKWQLMAERHKQRSEGGDGFSSSLPGRALLHNPSPKSGKGSREHQETENRGHPATLGPGGVRRMPHLKVARSISMKDVISALEREPRMSKSSLVFRLYGRSPAGSAPK